MYEVDKKVIMFYIVIFCRKYYKKYFIGSILK